MSPFLIAIILFAFTYVLLFALPKARSYIALCSAVIDPPRKGTTRELIAEIARRDIRRVVYISCEPETQGRDCAVFREFGYGIGEVQPVDLFPRTGHVENIVCLTKRI